MSEEILDGIKWHKKIMQSEVLKNLLKDKDFLSEQMDKVLKTIYKGTGGVDSVRLIKGLENVLELDERVRPAAEGLVNNSRELKSLLHWYAIMVNSKARELNLMFARVKVVGVIQNE